MSLQIWLPLNGTFNNYGLTPISIESGSGSFSDGHLGKCLSSGGVVFNVANNLITTLHNEFTLCCWCKNVDPSVGSRWIFAIGEGTDTTRGLYEHNYTDSVHWAYQGTGVNMPNLPNRVRSINEWYHITFVVSGSNVKYYLNGEFQSEINNSKTNQLVGEKCKLYPISMHLSDFRLYNHSLSAKEVKEVSKGLCLHYKLSGPTNENFIKGNYAVYSTATSFTQMGSAIVTLPKAEILSHRGQTLCLSAEMCSTGANTSTVTTYQKDRFGIHGVIDFTKTGVASARYFPLQLFSLGRTGLNYVTWDIPNDMTSIESELTIAIGVDPSSGFARPATSNTETWYIRKVKLEWGETPTPWIPNRQDPMFAYTDVEYDCSGFTHHGKQSGTIGWNLDTPRYTTCYELTNAHILGMMPNVIKPTKSVTMSIWVKLKEERTSGELTLFNNYEGGGIGLDISDVRYGFQIYSNGYKGAWVNMSGKMTQWHHFVGTFDGTDIKTYIDGELASTNTIGPGAVITHEATTPFAIGVNPNTQGASGGMNGYVCDARIYGTVLTADEIKELYDTTGFITDTGIVMGYNLQEI